MKRLPLFLGCCAMVYSGALLAQKPPTPPAPTSASAPVDSVGQLSRAEEAIEKRQYAQAVQLLEQLIKREPQNMAARKRLGDAYILNKEYGRAISLLTPLTQTKEATVEPVMALAWALTQNGKFIEAILQVQKAQLLGLSEARANEMFGRIEEAKGNFALASIQYRRAHSDAAKDGAALAGEAIVAFQMGNVSAALEQANQAIAALQNAPENTPWLPETDRGLARAKRVLSLLEPMPKFAEANAPAPAVFGAPVELPVLLETGASPDKPLINALVGGIAIFDANGDGLPDLFFAGAGDPATLAKPSARYFNRLLRNKGNFVFQDVSLESGLLGDGFAITAAAADFDRNGDVDLFVGGAGKNQLYTNTKGVFKDVAATAGIVTDALSVGATWLDFDRDGWLDLFVVNAADWTPLKNGNCGDRERRLRTTCPAQQYKAVANRLYRNKGDGTFEDVTAKSGIGRWLGRGMAVTVVDVDRNGYADLVVANESMAPFVFRNRGNGTFEEVGRSLGLAGNWKGEQMASHGVAAADWNRDGLPDLLLTGLAGQSTPLYLQTADKGFQDATYPSGLGASVQRKSSWGATTGDFNNDGWPDLFLANSHFNDMIDLVGTDRYTERAMVFCQAGGRFAEPVAMPMASVWRGSAAADLNGDGKLDIVATRLGERAVIFPNQTPTGNWLKVRLGAPALRVKIGTASYEVGGTACGYASNCQGPAHFGLGDQAQVDVEVTWSNGQTAKQTNVKANQTITLTR